MPTPSEIKAQLEAKIAAEKRADDIKAKEFMQQTGSTSTKRAQDIPGFSAKPSQVKAGWEKKVEYESKADDIKAKEFTDKVDWSTNRAKDVEISVKPSKVKKVIEDKVQKQGRSDVTKARQFIKKSSKSKDTILEGAPRIVANPDEVKGNIENKVEKEQLSADEKARTFLEETTYLGVEKRKTKSNLIPLSVLFSKPHKDQLKISPNGTYLAWRTRGRSMADPNEEDNGIMNLFVKHRETSTIRQITFYKELDACVYYTFTPDDKSIVFLREMKRGSENYHLYAIEIEPFFDQDDKKANDSKSVPPAKPRDLILNRSMTCGIGFVGGTQLWTCPESPRFVYVSTSQIGPYSLFWDVSRVDIDTYDITVVEQNIMSSMSGMIRVLFLTFIAKILSLCCIKVKPPGIPLQWFPDDELSFRGRIEVDLNLCTSFCVRPKNENKKWNTLHSCSFKDTNIQLLGSSGGAGTARMEFHGSQVDIHMCAFKTMGIASDTTTYERFNANTGQYLKRIAGENAKSDITGFVVDANGRAQFVQYEVEKPVLECIPGSESFVKDDLKFIKSFLKPSMIFQIVSRTTKDDAWVIHVQSDEGDSTLKGSPSAFFLFNRSVSTEKIAHGASSEINRSIELLFPTRPEMNRYKLARVYPVSIKARDGEDILCYLTSTQVRPTIKGRQQELLAPPSPMVVVIHGGPQARDSWGYNPLCQFLASRGFAVLQVNYRGSTGFGARFLRRGMNGEFYKSVQTDIEDAVKYATSPFDAECDLQGDMPFRPWGDAKQLAVLGGSFGGYSALWQMTANPGLYKCAVAICPISSVGAADAESKKAFGGSPLIAKYWKQVFGKNVSSKKAAAMKASPMYHINKIPAGSSVALYHGENDPRAPIQHSYNILRELKECGVAGEMVAFADEGHGISNKANVLYMYYRIEEFLCKQFDMTAFDSGDDVEQFEQNTGTLKWSAEYKCDV